MCHGELVMFPWAEAAACPCARSKPAGSVAHCRLGKEKTESSRGEPDLERAECSPDQEGHKVLVPWLCL